MGCSKLRTHYVRGQGGKVLAEYEDLDEDPTARYIYAGHKRIAMIDSDDNVYYYLNDHLGSAGVLITSTGTVRDIYKYKPFGDKLSSSVQVGQAYRYTGKPLDEELDLDWYYYGARYYDPSIGRFLAVDQLAIKYPGWSPYVYCLNNPLKLIDPNGLESNFFGNILLKTPQGDRQPIASSDQPLVIGREKIEAGMYYTMIKTGEDLIQVKDTFKDQHGWYSLAIGTAGTAALFIPGGQGVGVALIGTATGIDVVGFVVVTVDNVTSGDPDWERLAADVLTRATGMATKARLIKVLTTRYGLKTEMNLSGEQIAAIADRMWDMTTAGDSHWKSKSRLIGCSWRKAVYTDGSEEYLYSNPVYENVD